MKRYSASAAALAIAMACGMAQGAVVINETFPTNGTIADYTGAGKAFGATQGAATPAMPVAGGKATFGISFATSPDGAEGTLRSDLGGPQNLVSIKVDVTPNALTNSSFRLMVGNSGDIAWNQWDFAGRTHAFLNITTSGIAVGNAPSVPFALGQTHTLSLFLNSSGAAQSYTAPDGAAASLNDGAWSVYDGTTLVVGNLAANGAVTMDNLGFMFSKGGWQGDVVVDLGNLVIRNDVNMYPIPEPSSLGLIGLGGLALLRRRR